MAYQTAWFKCHYPREYMAALLTSVLDSQGKIAEYIAECRSLGIRLLPPDINQSGPDFTVAGQDIRFGLAALKGVGRGFTNAVLAQRQAEGPFRSFPDFCQRLQGEDLNKRVVESLIRAGAFDAMGVFRSQLMAAYEPFLDSLARNRRKNLEGQFDLFSLGQDQPEPVELVLPNLPEYPPQERMAMEKDVTGLYLSGHPMDAYRETIPAHGAVPIASVLEDAAQEAGLARFQDGQKVVLAGVVAAAKTKTTRNNTLMAYVTLEDDTGSLELMAFSRTLEESGSYLQVNVPILVEGKLSLRDEKPPQVLCDRVFPLNQVPQAPSTPPTASSTCALNGATIPSSPGCATSLSSSPASRRWCSTWRTPSAGWGPSASSCPPCSKNSRTCWGRPTSLWFPNPPCPRERKSCYVPTCAQRALPPPPADGADHRQHCGPVCPLCGGAGSVHPVLRLLLLDLRGGQPGGEPVHLHPHL